MVLSNNRFMLINYKRYTEPVLKTLEEFFYMIIGIQYPRILTLIRNHGIN